MRDDPGPVDNNGLQRILASLRRAREMEWPRLLGIREALHNHVADIYVPKEATKEYRMLVDQSRFNILTLVVDAVSQNLFVDGYRPTGPGGRILGTEDAEVWQTWQANRMDARQAGVHRAGITYGAGYTVVLPGEPKPKITPWSPLRLTALYEDAVNDEWPEYAMTVDQPEHLTPRHRIDPLIQQLIGPATVRVYDSHRVYTIAVDLTSNTVETVTTKEHGLGVTPVIRYWPKYDTDGYTFGKIEPLLPIQRQLNQTTFSLSMTQQYQAFRQRWATGMAIEIDKETGKPVEPFNSSVASLWQNESPDGKFGSFEATSLDGYLNSRDKALLHIASVAQIPPHNLLVGNGISNISAEALAAIEAGHRQDIGEHQTSYGEAHEQTLRLAGRADNDERTAEDVAAQVVWRDTTPRSLAQIADALGKLAGQLGIPAEALWERIPGVTDQDLSRWREMKQREDVMNELRGMFADEADNDEPPEEDQEEPAGGVETNGSTPVRA